MSGDALLADRPYRTSLPLEQVLGILRQDAGTNLCHDCVCALEMVVTATDVQAGRRLNARQVFGTRPSHPAPGTAPGTRH